MQNPTMIEKGSKWNVGTHGYVRYIDHMGTDHDIAEAARTSYGSGTSRKTLTEGLIRHLMRNRHTSPFEMAEIKIEVQCPIYIFRQWIRHRTANVNEMSLRFSEAMDLCETTAPDEWRGQSSTNKQGSSGSISVDCGEVLSEQERLVQDSVFHAYETRIRLGVAREQARKILPVSNYTRAYWKCDLHNFLHFLQLRLDTHAQKEIRDFATTIAENIIEPLYPITYRAFRDYRLDAITFSGPEIKAIQLGTTEHLIKKEVSELEEKMKVMGWSL